MIEGLQLIGETMSVIRVKHRRYTVIENEALENPNLSFKAKGLLAYCMSRPDDWEFRANHLSTVSTEAREATLSALKELENEGYLTRVQKRDNGKFDSYDYEICDVKKSLPQTGFPFTGKPLTDNPQLLNTDKQTSTEKNIVCTGGVNPPQNEEISLDEKKDKEILKSNPMITIFTRQLFFSRKANSSV